MIGSVDVAKTIGIIGGTGPEGKGLALRFALAGLRVIIGSREASRAAEAASVVAPKAPAGSITGALNADAAQAGIVVISVPYAAQKDTLEPLKASLEGKLVISVVAPMTFANGRAAAVAVPEGSAARQAQMLLPGSRIVAAFHNVSARDLLDPQRTVESDVVVCSDDGDAKQEVMALAELIPGVRAVNGGGLDNARYVEDLTSLLVNINRIYKAHSSIKFVGI
ncbi:MAG: NADPH-dependent F420 reductase [SAR202 cluster bacterium]|nr:NADPH-dependent F420 reductase [SAR202 cluster bacterium]